MVRRSSATSRGTGSSIFVFLCLGMSSFPHSQGKNVAKEFARPRGQHGAGLTVEDSLGMKLREGQFYQNIISLSNTLLSEKFQVETETCTYNRHQFLADQIKM